MNDDLFLTKLEDQIFTITFNSPQQANRLTASAMSKLAELIKQANLDDAIRCIIVTGSGNTFCGGADISQGTEVFNFLQGPINEAPGIKIAISLFNSNKPIIAAINGHAVGIGSTMLLPMDFRLMADTAKLSFGFTRLGVVPEAGSTWLLPRIVGLTKAADWMISGRFIEAPEAKESHLVTGVYPAKDLLPAAYELAHNLISTTSAISVACTRRLLLKMQAKAEFTDATAIEGQCFFDLINGPDAAEGLLAFLEKRPAHFTGKVSTDLPRNFNIDK